MATLLHLDTGPLASSVSRKLTREFVSNWMASHPTGKVINRDLAANPPKPVDQAWIYAAFTPEQHGSLSKRRCLPTPKRHRRTTAGRRDVIGVAMHNFSIPSVLKLWIDQIVRSGRTFA